MKVIYILARSDFFSLGRNGRVSHASGIANGISDNNVKLTLISGECSDKYITNESVNNVVIPKCFFILWHLKVMINAMKEFDDNSFVIIRYATKSALFYMLFFNVLFKKRWGFELNGLGYHQYSNLKIDKILIRTMRFIERRIIKSTPFVNCVSNSIYDDIKSINENVFVIPNAGGAVDNALSSISYNPNEKKIKLVYFGMYHNYYSLIELAKDVININDGFIELHLYGSGLQEDELNKLSEESNNVYLHGRYNLDDLVGNGCLSGNTFLILPYKSGTVADYGSPTKLFEYMALGLPIISTSFGQPYDLLSPIKNRHHNAVFFYDESISEVIGNIKNVQKIDREHLVNMFLSKHSWSGRCADYLLKIKKYLSEC